MRARPGSLAICFVALSAAPTGAQGERESGELRLHLAGVAVGRERWRRIGDTLEATTEVAAGPRMNVSARLVPAARGGTRRLLLDGRAFPWEAPHDSAARPVPIGAPFPVAMHAHVIASWKRAGRPARMPGAAGVTIAVEPCVESALSAATLECHVVSGLGWGRSVVWRDADGSIAAAVVPTPLGAIVGANAAVAAPVDSLLADAARITLRRALGSAATTVTRAGDPSTRPPSGALAIVGARVLAMTDTGALAAPLVDATVLVRDGRIVAVGPRARVAVPRDARTIDARGLTVLPGLWDSHAHLKQAEWLPAYLAMGVTSVRDVGSAVPFLAEVRRMTATSIELRGRAPRIVAAGFLNPLPADQAPHTSNIVRTAAEAHERVERYARLGYDQLKLWGSLPDSIVSAAVAEARRHGMPVTWHTFDASPEHALDLGVDGFNHIWAFTGPFGDSVGPADAGRSLLERMRAAGTVVDPTLVVAVYQNRPRDVPLASLDPCASWMSPTVVRPWIAFGVDPAEASAGRARTERAFRAVRALHDGGVTIVAGTDGGLPGCALLHELELYVGAGLSPRDALRTATVNAARAAGLADEVGTIEPGRRADLVLLGSDPLADIRALRDVRVVVRDGAPIDPADMRRRALLAPPDTR